MLLSVILCTHNPRLDYLRQTLRHLYQQSLNREQWELLIIDNASFPVLKPPFLPPNSRLIREEHPGLARARGGYPRSTRRTARLLRRR